MKHLFIYIQFFLALHVAIHAMESVPFNGFPFLPEELFFSIMMLTQPTKSEKCNVKKFFAMLYSYCIVCPYWHKQITDHKNYYENYFSLLPLHVAALVNDIMTIVNLKIDHKAQLYEKDKNGFLITHYAHKDINFIIQKYCRPIDMYPRDQIRMRYEKRIKRIRKKLDKKNKRKFNFFLDAVILEYDIHNQLNYYSLSMHLRMFDTLLKMKGNINAYDETGHTFLDKSCKAVGHLPYLTYLLSKRQVREYIIKENNAKKALQKCITSLNIVAMNKICMLKGFNIQKSYPNCARFFVERVGRYSSKNGSPIEAYLKTLDINWEIKKTKYIFATPLMLLMNSEREDFVLWLLKEKRVDPNAQNNDGDTALHLAVKVKKNNRQMINFLLDYNANPFIKNKDDKIPADLTKNVFNKRLLLKKMNINVQ